MPVSSLRRAQAALRSQDWAHALDLIHEAKAEPLAVEDARSLRLAEAAALRSIGRFIEARDIYAPLLRDNGLVGAERAEALHGLAECYLCVGDAHTAERLAAGSLDHVGADRSLRMRCVASLARATARRDLAAALELVRSALSEQNPPGSARAHLRFCEAELLLMLGDLPRARRSLGVARADASANDASRTVADVLWREASLAVLEGDQAMFPQAFTGLLHAERIYEGLADRSYDVALTARGELFKHRGNLARAAREFRRAAREAHQRQDQLMLAHDLLGLSDTLRLGGGEDLRHLAHAEEIYRRLDLAWGLLYCRLVVRGAAAARGDEGTVASAHEAAERLAAERVRELGSGDAAALTRHPSTPLALSFPR